MKKKIHIPIYDVVVTFIITENVRVCAKNLYKKWKVVYEEKYKDDPRALMIAQDSNTFFIIYKQPTLTYGVIAHEIYHVVEECIKHYSMTGSEEIAMLIEYMHDELYKFINKKKVFVK